MRTRRARTGPERDDGFTLVELLAVMMIIGILAAIAVPIFLGQRKKAFDASVKSDLRSVANEVSSYATDNQTYLVAGGWGGSTTATLTASTTQATAADTSSLWSTTATNYVGPDVVTLSQGTVVQVVYAGAKGFCLVGWNTKSATAYYTYDTLLSGLQNSAATAFGTSGCKGSGY